MSAPDAVGIDPVVAVFLPDWNRLFAIRVPSSDQGWMYSSERSSSRFHFWTHSNQDVIFACRTLTCLSAPFAQEHCFSCKNRGIRRQSCQSHMVLCYLYSNTGAPIDSFLMGELSIEDANILRYESLFPTPTRSAGLQTCVRAEEDDCNSDLEAVLRMEEIWARVESRLLIDSMTVGKSVCCFAVQQVVRYVTYPTKPLYDALIWQLRHSVVKECKLPLLDSPFYNTTVLFDAPRIESWLQLYATFDDAEIRWARYSWSKESSFDDKCVWPCLFNCTKGLDANQYQDTLILLIIAIEPCTQTYGDHILVMDKTLVLPFVQL
jgi:hypothetical protein